MSFWEQFLLNQASAALHAVVAKYASKYFSPYEQGAVTTTLDALIALPERIHNAQTNPPKSPQG